MLNSLPRIKHSNQTDSTGAVTPQVTKKNIYCSIYSKAKKIARDYDELSHQQIKGLKSSQFSEISEMQILESNIKKIIALGSVVDCFFHQNQTIYFVRRCQELLKENRCTFNQNEKLRALSDNFIQQIPPDHVAFLLPDLSLGTIERLSSEQRGRILFQLSDKQLASLKPYKKICKEFSEAIGKILPFIAMDQVDRLKLDEATNRNVKIWLQEMESKQDLIRFLWNEVQEKKVLSLPWLEEDGRFNLFLVLLEAASTTYPLDSSIFQQMQKYLEKISRDVNFDSLSWEHLDSDAIVHVLIQCSYRFSEERMCQLFSHLSEDQLAAIAKVAFKCNRTNVLNAINDFLTPFSESFPKIESPVLVSLLLTHYPKFANFFSEKIAEAVFPLLNVKSMQQLLPQEEYDEFKEMIQAIPHELIAQFPYSGLEDNAAVTSRLSLKFFLHCLTPQQLQILPLGKFTKKELQAVLPHIHDLSRLQQEFLFKMTSSYKIDRFLPPNHFLRDYSSITLQEIIELDLESRQNINFSILGQLLSFFCKDDFSEAEKEFLSQLTPLQMRQIAGNRTLFAECFQLLNIQSYFIGLFGLESHLHLMIKRMSYLDEEEIKNNFWKLCIKCSKTERVITFLNTLSTEEIIEHQNQILQCKKVDLILDQSKIERLRVDRMDAPAFLRLQQCGLIPRLTMEQIQAIDLDQYPEMASETLLRRYYECSAKQKEVLEKKFPDQTTWNLPELSVSNMKRVNRI